MFEELQEGQHGTENKEEMDTTLTKHLVNLIRDLELYPNMIKGGFPQSNILTFSSKFWQAAKDTERQ